MNIQYHFKSIPVLRWESVFQYFTIFSDRKNIERHFLGTVLEPFWYLYYAPLIFLIHFNLNPIYTFVCNICSCHIMGVPYERYALFYAKISVRAMQNVPFIRDTLHKYKKSDHLGVYEEMKTIFTYTMIVHNPVSAISIMGLPISLSPRSKTRFYIPNAHIERIGS